MADKLCTIVCDASFCTDTNVGGWAVWIVCNDTRFKHYGAFKEKCGGSGEAEIKAAINGLYLAKFYFGDVTRFHFVVDCREVIDHIEKKDGKWWRMMKDIAGNAQITAKHVRGHTRDGSKRSWVNRWCDKHTRQAMKTVR